MSENTNRERKISLGTASGYPSFGGVYPGDLVETIEAAPAIEDMLRVPWKSRNSKLYSQRTIVAPADDIDTFLFEILSPAGTAGPNDHTAVRIAAPGDYKIQHEYSLDLRGGRISMLHVEENGSRTWRTFENGRGDTRDIAHLCVVDRDTVLVLPLWQNNTECHLTLKPEETGEKRMVCTMRPREGEGEWFGGLKSHRYRLEDGKVTEMERDDDDGSEKAVNDTLGSLRFLSI